MHAPVRMKFSFLQVETVILRVNKSKDPARFKPWEDAFVWMGFVELVRICVFQYNNYMGYGLDNKKKLTRN